MKAKGKWRSNEGMRALGTNLPHLHRSRPLQSLELQRIKFSSNTWVGGKGAVAPSRPSQRHAPQAQRASPARDVMQHEHERMRQEGVRYLREVAEAHGQQVPTAEVTCACMMDDREACDSRERALADGRLVALHNAASRFNLQHVRSKANGAMGEAYYISEILLLRLLPARGFGIRAGQEKPRRHSVDQ
jgi:hypothetical protein